MKNLYRLIITAAITGLTFSSCQLKDGIDPAVTSSMKLTANSTAISYNSCQAAAASVNGAAQTLIIGNNITGTNISNDTFEVDILKDITTLKAGDTYPIAAALDQAWAAILSYSTDDTHHFTTQTGNPTGTVSIISVTATTIKGTFSGNLFDASDFTGTTLLYTVTKGTFTATIVK